MKRLLAALALLGLAFVATADAQLVPFPQSLPANTVVGRLGISAGPAQAIPFAQLTSTITGQPLTSSNDTNVTVTLGGTPAVSVLQPTSITMGWAGQLSIARGGTSQTTAAAARAASGLNVESLHTTGDTTVAIASTTRVEATSATLTASRAWTLPAANALNPGQSLIIADIFGGINGANTIVVTRAGADTIAGANTTTMSTQYQVLVLVSDGTSKWSFVSTAGAGSAKQADQQVFTGSGTWTKPSGFGAKSYAFIQCWGAGAGASRDATASNQTGGGGGAYKERWILLSSLGATETVTIGAGGAAATVNGNAGSPGGNSTFGALLTAYAGSGGSIGSPGGLGGGVGASASPSRDAVYLEGGQGAGPTLVSQLAGQAVHGGGGGGSQANTPGGVSQFGGNGATATAGTPSAGSTPGGGGAASTTAGTTGSAGGAGKCIATSFDGA